MSILLISILIPTLAFIFEVFPRLLNRRFGVDIWTHLLYLKEYHRQNRIPQKIENGFIVSGTYDYPPAFTFILSKFPFRLVEKYEFIFSPFFDSLHILLIFLIAFFLTNNIYIALTTQILYLLTPIIVLENSSATPRSLGYTLFTIVYFSLFLFEIKGEYLFLATSIVFGSFIFLSHRFTTQGFLFFSIFFAVITRNLFYLYAFIISLFLSLFLSKGFYLRVLRGHIGNLKFWRDNISFRYYHQIKGKHREYKENDFIFRLYNEFLKFPPFVLTITSPWTLPVFYIALFSNPTGIIYQRFLELSLFFYFISLLTTWVKKFRFLGEGQRYLELCAFPVAFLSSKFLFESLNSLFSKELVAIYIALGIASFVTIIVIQSKGIIKDRLRTLTPEMSQMFKYLKSLKDKPRLLCIPHQITTNTIYHTGCSVFVNADYASINRISEVYPYLRKPIAEIINKYNLDMILLNEEYAKISDLKLGRYKIIKKIDNYILIKP